jgi:hypothetical protein
VVVCRATREDVRIVNRGIGALLIEGRIDVTREYLRYACCVRRREAATRS